MWEGRRQAPARERGVRSKAAAPGSVPVTGVLSSQLAASGLDRLTCLTQACQVGWMSVSASDVGTCSYPAGSGKLLSEIKIALPRPETPASPSTACVCLPPITGGSCPLAGAPVRAQEAPSGAA